MSTEQCPAGSAVQATLDARLDAVDRLFMGLIPRQERLAIVAELEGRVRGVLASTAFEQPAACIADPVGTPAPFAPAPAVQPNTDNSVPRRAPAASNWNATLAAPYTATPSLRLPRSSLAFTSGLLGIVACALLMGSPFVYMGAMFLGEILDETGMLIGLGGYLLTMLLGSAAAIGLGALALWRLRNAEAGAGGRGWAVAGLCTAPVPFALASLITLSMGLPMLAEMGLMGLSVAAVSSADETSETANESPAVSDDKESDDQPDDSGSLSTAESSAPESSQDDGQDPNSQVATSVAKVPDPTAQPVPAAAENSGAVPPSAVAPGSEAVPQPVAVPQPDAPAGVDPKPAASADGPSETPPASEKSDPATKQTGAS
ncbi:MAG TPA: hypothetical protein VL475_06530 [Planctomycetaceae bacterium]|nr:hypothetical protein [Planctomycetaceae bacterium]